jgi:RNA polymerase sigma-70 factor (ECF subfamily)
MAELSVSKSIGDQEAVDQDAVAVESDAELIAAYLAGKEEAFNRLVMRHHRTAFNLAYRFLNDYDDANDIAQEAFIRVHKSLKRFKGNCSFKTWLYKIVLNLSRNKYRWKKRRGEFTKVSLDHPGTNPENNPMDVPDEAMSVDREIKRKEIQARIEESLNRLPAEYREILVLRHMEGLTYTEISELLGCAEGTIKSRLHRARVEIRKLLADMVEA